MKTKSVIVDLDGTLCDVNHRIHLLEQEKCHRSNFFKKMSDDSVYEWCRNLIRILIAHYEILFLTGRPELYRVETAEWIYQHVDLSKSEYELFMRETDDYRLDYEVKKEIFNQQIADNYDVEFVIEDRKNVVKMWRELGLTCLQCQEGNY